MPRRKTTAGTLDQEITILTKVTTGNSAGQLQADWQPAFTRWAEVRVLKSDEVTDQLKLQRKGKTEIRVVVRFDPQTSAIDRTARLDWQGRTFFLTSAEDVDGGRQWITIEAEESQQ